MPSFGENLRREREKRQITLDQISQSTKIGTRMLQALEEDKFNQLPGGIFNKGFVRAYARCVGLDEEQTVADYLEASGESAPVMPEMGGELHQPAPRIIEATSETPERPLPWGLFAALLLLAALALSLWSRRQTSERAAQHPPLPVATQTPQNSPPSTSPTTTNPAANTTNAAPAAKPPSTASSQPAMTSGSATASAAGKAPTELSAPAAVAGGFLVNVQAHDDSWTVITSDGRTVYSGLLAAGDQRAIRGQKQISVKAGNSGGLDLFFNGKRVAQQGELGEVRTITFGPDGLMPNAPTPPLQ